MVLRTTLLLLVVNLTTVQLWHYSPLGKCNFKYKLVIGQVLVITSPRWPGTYRAGESCRWTFDCPFGYFCHMRCHYVSIPYSPGCIRDRLLVSIVGDTTFKEAEVFCGHTYIKAKSNGTRIVLGLATSEHTTGGSFKCAVRTEPVTHIDTFINALGIKSDYKVIKRLRGNKALKNEYQSTSPRMSTNLSETANFPVNQQSDVAPGESAVEAIVEAIGLVTTKRIPTKKPVVTPRKLSNTMHSIDSLINFLGLKTNKRTRNNTRSVSTPPRSPTATTIVVSSNHTNTTKYVLETRTELLQINSIFDALIEAIG